MGRGPREEIANQSIAARTATGADTISQTDRNDYLTGQCAGLAVALQEKLGGEIVAIGYDDSVEEEVAWQADPRYDHFGLELEDGRIIDIDGEYKDLNSWMERHNYWEARTFSADEALSLPYYPDQDLARARQIGGLLISAHNLDN